MTSTPRSAQIYERGDRVLHVGYLVDERPGKPRR
jgi:hypothetical protein